MVAQLKWWQIVYSPSALNSVKANLIWGFSDF